MVDIFVPNNALGGHQKAQTYEAKTLFGLGVSRCQTRIVSDTDTTPTLVITLNYVIFFLNY